MTPIPGHISGKSLLVIKCQWVRRSHLFIKNTLGSSHSSAVQERLIDFEYGLTTGRDGTVSNVSHET
jgi:hypothetical protein